MTYFYQKGEEKICASDCKEVTGYEYVNGNQCASHCLDGYFLQDETKKVCDTTCASGKFKTSSKGYVCLASDKECDSSNGGEWSEIVEINGQNYTHCIADCSKTYLEDVAVFKYEEEKTCMTREQCNADNRYVFYVSKYTHLCLSVKECVESKKGAAFAVGECKAIAVKEDDFTKDKETGVYTCKDSKYLYFNTKAECVDFAGCNNKTGTVIYEPTKQCLSNNECTKNM